MYAPAHFDEQRPEVLQALMAAHPLATVVSAGEAGLVADHIPLLHRPDPAGHGVLIGHVARANPLWRHADREHLLVFQGPQAYISPNWYPSKRVDARVVPTWNYAVVHAQATLRAIEDHAGILAIVGALTARHEASQPHPWQVGDAPAEHIERLLGVIVGVEFRITRLQGKWKVSQNQPSGNREGAARGLAAQAGDPVARQMADLVRRFGPGDGGTG